MPQRVSYRDRVRARIERYQPADLEEFCAFRRTLFGADSYVSHPEYVRWLYERDDSPPLWLYRLNGALEAFHGSIVTTVYVNGRPYPAIWAVELLVSPAQLMRGVGAVLAEHAIADFPLALGFDVTDAGKQLVRRAGWSELGDVALFSRPVRARPFAEARGRPLPTPVAWSIDVALRATEIAMSAWRQLRGQALIEVDRFDGRVDALWSSTVPHYSVIAKRDAAWLNWRFADYPESGYYRRFILRHGDRIAGCAVMRLEPRDGILAGWIVDFLCPPRSAVGLLLACAGWLRHQGADAVYCIQQDRRLTRWLLACGFIRRSTGFPLVVFGPGVTGRGRDRFLTLEDWFITGGDSNVDRPRSNVTDVYST
ncbi:MAG: hypothetical protein ACRDZ2_14155 [Ilumatobacteraceae bacterium]